MKKSLTKRNVSAIFASRRCKRSAPKTKRVSIKSPKVYETDRAIGRGCWKTCYTVKGDADKVVLISCSPGHVKEEFKRFKALKKYGIPVPEGLKLVRAIDPITKHESDGILMERYEYHSKSHSTDSSPYQKELNKIQATIKEHQLRISDLQFLCRVKAGKYEVVVTDPLDVQSGRKDYSIVADYF